MSLGHPIISRNWENILPKLSISDCGTSLTSQPARGSYSKFQTAAPLSIFPYCSKYPLSLSRHSGHAVSQRRPNGTPPPNTLWEGVSQNPLQNYLQKGLKHKGLESSSKLFLFQSLKFTFRAFVNGPRTCRQVASPKKNSRQKDVPRFPHKNQLALQEINISHLEKRKIIFKYALSGGYVNPLEGSPKTPKTPQWWCQFEDLNTPALKVQSPVWSPKKITLMKGIGIRIGLPRFKS